MRKRRKPDEFDIEACKAPDGYKDKWQFWWTTRNRKEGRGYVEYKQKWKVVTTRIKGAPTQTDEGLMVAPKEQTLRVTVTPVAGATDDAAKAMRDGDGNIILTASAARKITNETFKATALGVETLENIWLGLVNKALLDASAALLSWGDVKALQEEKNGKKGMEALAAKGRAAAKNKSNKGEAEKAFEAILAKEELEAQEG